MTLPGLLSTITVTAELSMANAPWLTEPYIEIEWSGLMTERWSPVTGTATIPANQVGELLQALSGLAARAVTDDERAAVEGDRDALTKLIDNLTDIPTPAGPTPTDLGTGAFIPLTTLLETLPQQRSQKGDSK